MSSEPRHNNFLALGPHGFHRVAYTEWGNPDGLHLVVCVHGLTRNSRDFDELAASLADRGCRIACMDVVGRGDSDWLEHKQDYGFSQYLSDAAALLARLTAPPKRVSLLRRLQRGTENRLGRNLDGRPDRDDARRQTRFSDPAPGAERRRAHGALECARAPEARRHGHRHAIREPG